MLIAIASEKGGSGKTTIASLIAERLYALGLPVLCADADSQASLSALCEQDVGKFPYCREVFPRSIPKLTQEEGIVLLDLPSGVGDELDTALSVANLVLIPVVASTFDLRTLPVTLDRIARAQELRGGLPKALLVLNKINSREMLSRRLREEISALGWPVAENILKERSAFRRIGHKGLNALPRSSRRDAEAEVARLVDEVLAVAGLLQETEV